MGGELELRELTAAASGGVSVLELRGAGALERARGLARRPTLAPGALCFTQLFSTDSSSELLDEAMLWVLNTDHVELHVHGSLPLVARLKLELNLPIRPPATDLESHAIELCAHAASESAARVLLDQAQGALRAALHELSKSSTEVCRAGLEDLLRVSLELRPLFEVPLVVLAGPVNAGKSTLFNLLMGRERVITDAARGTTRDVIRERVQLGAYAFDLVDTAGLRELGTGAEADLERAGQALGMNMRSEADLVLWLLPEGRRLELELPQRTCLLRSQASEVVAGLAGAPSSICVLEDPHGSAEVLKRLIVQELHLQAQPWQAERPVLFEPLQLARVQEALREPTGLTCVLESLLAR
jgi:hypothetical protein